MALSLYPALSSLPYSFVINVHKDYYLSSMLIYVRDLSFACMIYLVTKEFSVAIESNLYQILKIKWNERFAIGMQ